jgi:uncharacterized protein with HEPN domain
MLPDIKNDLVYLLIILESIEKVNIYSKDYKTFEEFYNSNEQKEFNASLLLLINISEQTIKISPELKEKYAHIPWIEIKGFRNRGAHDYTGIDSEYVYKIIKSDLKLLKENLFEIINEELLIGNFDKEELLAAKASSFYRHIDFSCFK